MNTHTHSTHSAKHKSVGKHPDRPAHSLARLGAMQTEEPSDEIAGGFSSILRRMPIVLGVTVLSGLLLTTALCLIAFSSPDPTALIRPCATVALMLSALCGGITAGKLNPAAPLAAGLLCGTLTAGLLVLTALLTGQDGGLLHWGMRLAVIPAYLVGSAVTRPRKKAPAHTAGKHASRR